jgi:hypothetical protein
MRLSLMNAAYVALFGTAYRKYGYLPGFGRCGIPRLCTGHSPLATVFMSMVIYTLYTQGRRFVESHICQNRADMGHPSFVTD